MYNLKYTISIEFSVVSHNRSNFDYHFIIKELAKEFEGEFNCLAEYTEKSKTISVPITKEVKRIGKKGEKLQKLYPTNFSLIITQDLWQACYQILLIILLKEFIDIIVDTNMVINNVKFVELNSKTTIAILNIQTLKMI